MAKYRKRPVVIEAVQYSPDASDTALLVHLADCIGWQLMDAGIAIPTLEGMMVASPGDWIIRGVKGEYYPCKPDIFAATYELAAQEGTDG